MKELKPVPVNDKKIITDLRILKGIARRYNLIFDNRYKYITSEYKKTFFTYKGHSYKLQYFSGCFYPYIVQYN